jgi:hypothetical protein
MNEVFADGKALILKKDGLVLDFLAFANQNELPDLNLVGYLSRINEPENPSRRSIANDEPVTSTGEPADTVFYILMALFLIIALILSYVGFS